MSHSSLLANKSARSLNERSLPKALLVNALNSRLAIAESVGHRFILLNIAITKLVTCAFITNR